jgi:hypothetical protein
MTLGMARTPTSALAATLAMTPLPFGAPVIVRYLHFLKRVSTDIIHPSLHLGAPPNQRIILEQRHVVPHRLL